MLMSNDACANESDSELTPGFIHAYPLCIPMAYGRLVLEKPAGAGVDMENSFVPTFMVMFAAAMLLSCTKSAVSAAGSLMDKIILGIVKICPDSL